MARRIRPSPMHGDCSPCVPQEKCSDMSSYPSMLVNGFAQDHLIYDLTPLHVCWAGNHLRRVLCAFLRGDCGKTGRVDDVAGATLMATGGSAPELFTRSLAYFYKSDVGFSTIVGSAVFNVLVIGMHFFAKEVLVLTGWPITRDSIYYSITLITLAMFYNYNCDANDANKNAFVVGRFNSILHTVAMSF